MDDFQARPGVDDGEPEESYFIPMVDLLAGLLFVILLLLMSFAIVHFPEVLDNAPVPTELTVEPPVPPVVEATLRVAKMNKIRLDILERIKASLESAGIEVVLDNDNATLRIEESLFFVPGKSGLDAKKGTARAEHLARSLAVNLPCVAIGGDCPLERRTGVAALQIRLAVMADLADSAPARAFRTPQAFAGSRALTLFSAMVSSQPTLLDLRGIAGNPLVSVVGIAEPPSNRKEKLLLTLVMPEVQVEPTAIPIGPAPVAR